MFLKDTTRFKDGKEHHYWSLVENRRVDGGRKVVQRHVLYLGEINSSQQAAWRKTIEVFEAASDSMNWNCAVPDNGVLAGCAVCFIRDWSWMSFGASASGPAARAHDGIRCCRPW
jgi:hypothetical protein